MSGQWEDVDDGWEDVDSEPAAKPTSTKRGLVKDLVGGTKGSLAFAADVVGGIPKIIGSAAMASGKKIMNPSKNLQSHWEESRDYVERLFPSFGAKEDVGQEPAYKAGMYPFEKYGEGLEWLAKKGSMGNKDVEGAINIGGNFLPIPLIKPAAKAGGKLVEVLDPGLRKTIYEKPQIDLNKIAEPKDAVVTPETPDPGIAAMDRIVESQITGWNEPLPPRGSGNGLDTITQQLEADRQSKAQTAIDERQRAMELEVRRQTNLDMNAAERARQEQAPVPGLEDARAREIESSIARTQELNQRGQQMNIVEDYGNNDPMSRMPEMRVDENGIPIRADLSMEAQNLENPLQRNLWGDELGPALGQERSLTDAIDAMPKGIQRNIALNRLGKGKYQSGAIDPSVLTETIKKLFHGGREFKEWDPKMVGKGEGMGALGPGLYAADERKLAEIYVKYGQKLDIDESGNVHLTPGVLNEMAVDTSNILDYRAKNDKWRAATEALDKLGYKASTLGIQRALQKAQEYGPGEGRKARQVMIDVGIDGMYIQLGGTMGKEIVIFNPEVIKQVSRADTPVERYVPKSQRGAIDLGPTPDKNKLEPGTRPTKEDSKLAPITIPSIEAKEQMSKKLAAIDFKGTPYDIVSTLEEAKHNTGPDLSNNIVRDYVASGVEGQLRRNPKNKLLNYTRTLFSNARSQAEAFSSRYVTGKDGINRLYRDLNANEWDQVVQILQKADSERINLTPEMLQAAGANAKQIKLINRINEAMSEMYALGNAALMEQGFKPFNQRPGYIPAMFTGAYTSLVRVGDKTVGVAQADSARGLNTAIEYYKQKYPNAEIVNLPRQGLNTRVGYSRVFDGFNDIVRRIAENDPEFAELKGQADFLVAQQNKKLYGFDVHEKIKTGVEGAVGNRPWLERKENSKQFLEGMINYLEEGSRYYSYQGALNKAGEMMTDPQLRESHPNTLKYVDRYAKHVSGRNLSLLGATINQAADLAISLGGKYGPEKSAKILNELRYINSVHMMGLYNPAFFAMQLTQYATGGMPEALAIRQATGLSGADLGASLVSSNLHASALFIEMASEGKIKYDSIPPHIREAGKWMQEQGMLTFSEAELAHEVLQSKGERAVKKVASAPIEYGEKATRPPVFLLYVDLFHRAGLEGERLLQTAKNATDYAMANYHPDERPMLYSSLGMAGQFLGALTTYKHNLIEQYYTRGANAAKQPLALAAMLGMAYTMYGISGLPGYQEADQIVQAMTNKTIREQTFEYMPDEKLWDGVLSAVTGIDFNARLSMASVIPDNAGVALAGPHIANSARILADAYAYAKQQDQASLNELLMSATPSGARGITEDALRVDENGYVMDKEGQRKYAEPRTEQEREIRKWFALRPIRERLEDEDLYADRKANRNVTEKLRDQGNKIAAAINLDDEAGFKDAVNEYLKLGGDPTNLQVIIKNAVSRKNMTARERAQGGVAPKPSVGSTRQWQEFND